MTLDELEIKLSNLQKQIEDNTAALITLSNNLKEYATKDDLNELTIQVKELLSVNTTLQNTVGEITFRVNKVDHLSTLLDVSTDNITVNDVLQYGSDGKWHNIQPHLLKFPTVDNGSNSSTAISLSSLTDVYLSNLKDGQILTYSELRNKWVNKTIETNDDSGNTNVGDLSGYLTLEDAKKTYLPLSGGTLTGALTVNKQLDVTGNILATGGITTYNN